eukprot:4274540-Amphidinium_carterae.1
MAATSLARPDSRKRVGLWQWKMCGLRETPKSFLFPLSPFLLKRGTLARPGTPPLLQPHQDLVAHWRSQKSRASHPGEAEWGAKLCQW